MDNSRILVFAVLLMMSGWSGTSYELGGTSAYAATYSSKELADGVYLAKVEGDRSSDRKSVRSYFHVKTALLCGSNDYAVKIREYTNANSGFPSVEGKVRCRYNRFQR